MAFVVKQDEVTDVVNIGLLFSPVIEALKELGGSGRPAEVRDVIANRLNISE